MKVTLQYISDQKSITHRKGKIPTAVYMTAQQLEELNYDMRMKTSKAQMKDLQERLRPDLLPPMPAVPDIKEGDNIYGMDIYIGEEFKIKTMHG